MKKILLLVFLFVLGKMSYSQGYPLLQNLGSDSTIVVSKGALQSRLIPIVITDTNAANAQRLKSYPGAQLYTTAGDFYIRNSNATKWILVSSGSSGSVNIYTADGTLTGNRTLTGANNNLTFTGLNKFTVSTGDTTLFNTNTFGIKGVGGVLNVEGTAAGTTSSLTLKTASDGNWTISTGQVNFNSGDLRFYDNDNGANRMIIKPSGNVGIGTETPDSLLTVNGGVYIGGGIRAPGLPTALGTKALRINAQGQISVADTTLGGGTVTSVGTNNGSGITGGPITTSGTLAIDTTNVIATKASVSSGLAGKLNISDTASMLAPYLRAIDTASLSNRINLKLNISDTASMLGNYLNNVGYGLSKAGQVVSADSATLSNYYLRRKDSLTTTNPLGYVTKQILADTAAAIRSADAGGTVTSVGLTMPAAFNVGNSPITTAGTISVTAAGLASQYIRGDGTLADFPGGGGGGGASISYYLNGSVNQGTFGGNTYYEMNKTPIFGTGTDFSINADGYIAQFITDAGDPALLKIPGGNWNFELFFSASSGGGSPTYYVELYKYNGTTFTLIASGSTNPDAITGGTAVEAYFSTLPVPETVLTLTDRLAVRIYVTHAGRTITLHTEDNNLCQVITTFTTGITALNSLTAQVQYLTTGTSGTDFNISSLTDTHTFNLPTASATNRGALSTTDWTTFNNKVGGSLISGYIPKATGTNTLGNSIMQDNGSTINLAGGMIATGSLEGSGIRANDVIQFQNINTSSSLTGYTTLQADSTNKTFRFNFGDGVRVAEFKYAAGSYTYNLPSSNGTLALTSDLTGGTVTSVATNNGTGITGGTITTSGTLAIDTTVISTRAWRQKGIDSVASLITGSYVPLSRTLTINGTSFDLSANRTWNVGTVTTAAASGGGQVAFFNGSTVITSVTGLYFDGTNKLAIGSSSPDSMLSVTQGAHIQRGVRLSGLPTAPGTRSLRIDANGTLSVSDTLANGMSGSGTPNYIPKFTGSNSIGNSVIYESSSNIGIGTISPAQKLEVAGTLRVRSATEILDISAPVGKIDFNNVSGDPIGFSIGSSEKMRLDASGNLGLGVTPSAWGSVLKAFDIGTSGSLVSSASGAGGLSVARNAYYNGLVWIYKNTSTAQFYEQDAGQHAWYTAPSGTAGNAISFTQAMTLTASGNLGIGTTSPATKLQVVGTGVGGVGTIGIRGESSHLGLQSADGTFKGWYGYYNALTHGSDVDLNIKTGYAGASNIRFGVNGDSGEAMRITSGGNVGIGTTSPTSLFEVRGSTPFITISDDATTSAHGIRFAGNGVNIRGGFTLNYTTGEQNIYAGIAGNGYYQTFSLNGSERMRITSGGNVGIGTTSPAYKLEVDASNPTNGIVGQFYNTATSSQNGSFVLYTQFGIADWFIGQPAATNALTFGNGKNLNTVGSEFMRITSGGNVGIGTTSPTAVSNYIIQTINGLSGSFTEYQENGANAFRIGSDVTEGGFLNQTNAKPIRIFTSSTERMRITSSGNVGIGTSSPQERFDIAGLNGNIRIYGRSGIGENQIASNVYYNGSIWTRDNTSFGAASITLDCTNGQLLFNTTSATSGYPTERMRITSDGEVYIAGTTDQGAYNLQVNGTGVWGAGAYVNGSDSALKKNIQLLDNSLEIIKQMRPVTFEYQPFYSKDTATQTGFIAQDLKQLLANKVYKNGVVKEGGAYLGVAYESIIPLLVKSIQELEAQVQELKSQLNNK